MRDSKEIVKEILDNLAKEYGDETFVSDAYAYYDDALYSFSHALRSAQDEAWNEAVETCAIEVPIQIQHFLRSLKRPETRGLR